MVLNRFVSTIVLAGALLLVGFGFGANFSAASQAVGKLAGSYRCWSENVGGRGGRCAIGTPPLVLNADGTYSMSSEHGTYKVDGDTIVLSESKVRGPGRIVGGNQIVFEYDYRNLHHTVTYLRQ